MKCLDLLRIAAHKTRESKKSLSVNSNEGCKTVQISKHLILKNKSADEIDKLKINCQNFSICQISSK